MANITTILASATDLIPEECSSELELQIFSNEDMNFPINLNLDVDQNSIEFEKLSSPIYDYEYSLNEEKLDIDLIASLKTEFDDFDEYDIKIMSSDYDDVLFYQSASCDYSMTIPNLKVGETYSF